MAIRHSTAARTRRLRRELSYELFKLRNLEHCADTDSHDPNAKALATKVCEQAEICLELLDQYESSVPGAAWSEAARKCQPLREELKRTDTFFRTASGVMARRAGEDADNADMYEPSPSVRSAIRAAYNEPLPISQVRATSEASYYSPKHPYPRDVDLCLENDEPIMLLAVRGWDPVELNSDQARDLGLALIELADLSDAMQGQPD